VTVSGSAQAQPFAVGLNCALGASDMQPYIENLSKCADCYVFAYPNAGLPNAMGGYDQKVRWTHKSGEPCTQARYQMLVPNRAALDGSLPRRLARRMDASAAQYLCKVGTAVLSCN